MKTIPIVLSITILATIVTCSAQTQPPPPTQRLPEAADILADTIGKMSRADADLTVRIIQLEQQIQEIEKLHGQIISLERDKHNLTEELRIANGRVEQMERAMKEQKEK
jgi:TolA-binding protein